MRNWEIGARSRFCADCETPFEEGQVYHCLLDLSDDIPERKDYCVRCWKEMNPARTRDNPTLAYWRGEFRRLYTPVDREIIKRDVVRKLLDKYIKSAEPAHVNLCYILALLEERKKVLLPCREIRGDEGEKIVVYEHAESGDTYLIKDPGLTLHEVEEVQAQVQELIDQEKKGTASQQENEESEEEEED